jgi:two-component system, cell cycle sensor histidine kinase and response regulator CckA
MIRFNASCGNTASKVINERMPEMPILFASGYSQDAIDTDFILDDGVNLIQKPYRRAALLNKVRDLLDQ